MKRIAICAGLLVLMVAIAGCFEVAKYAAQHSIGARLGPCQPKKDSVQAALGNPYRRYFSDEENVSEKTQIFWHEWAYRIPKDSTRIAHATDSTAAPADSVKVIGFLWGHGVAGCSVHDRRVMKLDHPSVPWEGAGDLPTT